VDITVETYQGFLDDAYDASKTNGQGLRQTLRNFEKACNPLFQQGTLGNVAKNNASQSYRGPGLGSYTIVQIANTWRQLINLFDQSKNKVVWMLANPPSVLPTWWPKADNDASIYNSMAWQLGYNVSEYQVDLTDLRLHPIVGNSNAVLSW
jgi:hypothetical protein